MRSMPGTVDLRALPLPPGTLGLPYLGEGLAFLENPFDFFEQRFRRHGPVFKTRLFGNTVACFVGPAGFAFFYDDANVTRRDASPPHLRALLHEAAIPFLDGDDQVRRRRLMMQAFTPAAIASYQPLVERVIARHLDALATGQEVRAVDALGLLCFTVADVLFAGADPDRDRPDLAARFTSLMAGLTALPVRLPFTTYGKAIAARDVVRAYIDRAVDDHPRGSASHVLDRLLAARDLDGGALPLEEVKIETLHFFGAAHAGLQAALCDLLLALADQPELQARARAEVLARAPDGPIGDRLAGLDLCHRIGLELRRFYRIAPSTFFGTLRGDRDFAGHRIPAGWKALAVPHSTLRDDAVFPDAARFDPDRFASPRLEHQRPNHWVPHGGGGWGGHRCAGEAVATLVIDVFTAELLRRVTWELPEQDLGEQMAGLSPLPRDGLRVRFRPLA
jgi:cytochrome P450